MNRYIEKWIMRIIALLVTASVMTGGCSYVNNRFGLDEDNAIEESIEVLIEHHTGVDVDLTPTSEE